MSSFTVQTSCRLSAAITLALAGLSVHAATITVNSADDDIASTSCNLRNALLAVNNGADNPNCSASGVYGSNDTILLSAGIAGAAITLTQGQLALVGASATIAGSGQTITASANSRVFAVENAALSVSNLTFTDGSSATYGGGIYVSPTSLLNMDTCTVSGNHATTLGGGVYASGATVLIVNSTIMSNSATTRGGGIYATGGALEFENSTISNNTATDLGGGVMSANGNALIMDRSVVSGNSGVRAGGVYPTGQVTATITSSTISGNTGTCGASNAFCAGGIYAYQSTLSVIDSTLSGNMAQGANNYQGGAAYLFNSTGTFVNTTVTGNSAHGNSYLAGGLWELHDTSHTDNGLTLINCTISANSATSYLGSPAFISGGVEAGINGGNANYAGVLTSNNSIISANLPADSDVVLGAGSTTLSTAYNLFGTAENTSTFNDPANHNIFSDTPGLGALANNGGSTQIMALLGGSPALRAGSAAFAAFNGAPLYFDQRGTNYMRSFSGTVDIGAFEDQGDRVFASQVEAEP